MTPDELAALHAATCAALEAGASAEQARALRDRYAEACLEAGLQATAEGWLGGMVH